jgi:hypothetical protein
LQIARTAVSTARSLLRDFANTDLPEPVSCRCALSRSTVVAAGGTMWDLFVCVAVAGIFHSPTRVSLLCCRLEFYGDDGDRSILQPIQRATTSVAPAIRARRP